MNDDPIIMWPVEETGRNSVMPSIRAKIKAWREDMGVVATLLKDKY